MAIRVNTCYVVKIQKQLDVIQDKHTKKLHVLKKQQVNDGLMRQTASICLNALKFCIEVVLKEWENVDRETTCLKQKRFIETLIHETKNLVPTNEYIDEKGNICPINSLISPNLDNLQDAFQALRDSFSQLENAKSEFILGKRGMDEVFYVTVTGKAIIEKREKFPEDVLTVYGGRDEYIRIFDQNSRLNLMDGLGIKREIEGMVEFFDKHLDYNYVGGEIEILEWDWQY